MATAGARPAAPVIQRQEAEPPQGEPGGAGLDALSGIPFEKWAESIEYEHRLRGNVEAADDIRDCRTQGGAACERLITSAEAHRLYEIAQSSGGDPEEIERQLAEAARLLLLPSVRPPVLPVPAPAAAAAGPAAFIAAMAAVAYSAWSYTDFQDELRQQGYLILEDPLGLCISGCHTPSRPEIASPPLLSPVQDVADIPLLLPSGPPWVPASPEPLTEQKKADLERYLEGVKKEPQTEPAEVAASAPVSTAMTAPRRYPNQTCEDDVLNALQAEKNRICNAISGESCSPRKVSPKRLARRPCSEILLRLYEIIDCLVIRQRMQDECFGGNPDDAHRNAIQDMQNALQACRDLAAQNCAEGHPMANQ